MALTSISRSTGYQSNYVEATIEISGASGSGTFNIREGSLVFIGDTSERDQHARFSPMRVEFIAEIEDGNDTAMSVFIAELTSSSEEKYICKVSIDGALKFIGFVNTEGSEWEDLKNPRDFRIQAYDGLGRLEGQVFGSGTYETLGGEDTIETAIKYCMQKMGIGSYHSGTYYAILHSKIADGQTVSGNPMSNQRVDYGVWSKKGDNNIPALSTCKQVLEDIMIAYGLCLKYIGPHFLFYEPKMLASGGSAYAYSGGGSYTGTISVGGAVAIANNKTLATGDRKGISGYSALPPYFKAHIKYDHGDQNVNMLDGFVYEGYNHYQIPGPNGDLVSVGTVTVESGEIIVLRFSGKLRTNSKLYGGSLPPRWKNHRYHFRLRLKTTAGAVNTYWRRDYQGFDFYSTAFGNFENPYWDATGNEYYDFVTDIIDERNGDINIFTHVGFDTILLAQNAVHEVFFGFEVVRVFDENENLIDLGDNPDRCDWEFSDLSLVAVQDGNIVKRPTYTDYNAYGEDNNRDFYSATTHIGDGPEKTSKGRLKALMSGEWKDTKLWGGVPLLSKVTKEILGNRDTSVAVLTGGVYSMGYWFDKAFTYGGKTYLPMSVTYNFGRDEWTGEWVEFKVGSGGGTTKISVVKKDEQVELPKNPNRLPDDERLQDRIREIITGADGYKKGTSGITELELREAATYDYWKKYDKIDIIDPVIGYVDTLTLTQDVDEGDTSIFVEPWTPSEDFPPGSYLELNKKYSNKRKRYYQRNTDFTGTNWTITVVDLPDPANYTDDEMAAMLLVFRNGVKLMYDLNIDNDERYHKGFTVDVSGVNNRIVFLEALNRDVIEIFIDY